MTRRSDTWWCKLAIGALTLPLLQTSCVEIAQRTLINGLFDATVPVLDRQLEDRLTQVFAANEEP